MWSLGDGGIPSDVAIARVTFTGIPSGIGRNPSRRKNSGARDANDSALM